MTDKIKVFRLNEYEDWAGRNLEEVKADYLRQTGIREDEAFEDPGEFSDQAMDSEKFQTEDGEVITYRERLAQMIASGARFPAFFAGTEG